MFVFTTNVFSQECDETTRARMIKSGLSDKTIEEQCGKIDDEENISEKIEEIVVPTHDITEVRRGKRVQRKNNYI